MAIKHDLSPIAAHTKKEVGEVVGALEDATQSVHAAAEAQEAKDRRAAAALRSLVQG